MNALNTSLVSMLSLAASLGLGACASSRVASTDAHSSAIVADSPAVETTAAHDAAPADVPDSPARSTSDGTLTLNVAGLSCPQCATNIDLTVGRIKGVSAVEVDLGAGQVRVSMLPGQSASRAQIEQAVRDAGFEVVD